MKTYIQSISIYILAIFCLLILPVHANALSVSINTENTVHAKDVFIVNVSVDTEGQPINTIEGDIVFSDGSKNFEIRDVSIAGSAMTLWPRRPSLSTNGDSISFTGGVPGGVSGNISLFKIIVYTRNPSELRVGAHDVVAYANDGKGTALNIANTESIISIIDPLTDPIDRWTELVSKDNIPPEPFEIVLYQDPSLYGGQKFLSFGAVDMQSGVAYYEVQEGQALPVRTGDQYVLVNQDKTEDIIVTAYDIAGNARSGVFTGAHPINWYGIVFWTLILLIIAKRKNILRFIKRLRKRR